MAPIKARIMVPIKAPIQAPVTAPIKPPRSTREQIGKVALPGSGACVQEVRGRRRATKLHGSLLSDYTEISWHGRSSHIMVLPVWVELAAATCVPILVSTNAFWRASCGVGINA